MLEDRSLIDVFEGSRHTGGAGDDASCQRPVIHFMWICEEKLTPDTKGNNLCGIPPANIDAVVQNMKLYPNADYVFWYDKRLIDAESLFWVASYIDYLCGVYRIDTKTRPLTDWFRMRDLNEIPAYKTDPLFRQTAVIKDDRCIEGSVYVRADYARVLVLADSLQKDTRRAFHLYADTDCRDVRLPEAMRAMRRYGVVLDCRPERKLISHGFIGLNGLNDAVREKLPLLVSHAKEAAHNWKLGDRPVGQFVEALHPDHWQKCPDMKILVLPEFGRKLAPHDDVRSLAIRP